MRTPKGLYADERIIYHPELLTCPHCCELLVMHNYLSWDKTVQTLDDILSVASRPGHCPQPSCAGTHMRLLSAQGQGIAPVGSTYGYDVVARIGWLRYKYRATYSEIHSELSARIDISESHVRYLYQQIYLPLLACHERQHRDRLAQIAKQQGGEAQIWFIRELTSALTLRSGWLSQQDQATFEAFLKPLKHLEWPILAVLSDKQTGLMPAVAKVLPDSRYQFCQAHYLRNLAEPLAEVDAAFKSELRKAVRQQVGDLIRKESCKTPDQCGVLTVTGLLPSPLHHKAQPTAPDNQRQTTTTPPMAPAAEAAEILAQLFRHTRYLLTLKGRPPFRLAGIETYERLDSVARLSLDLLTERCEPRLFQFYQGLRLALEPFADTYQTVKQGAAWLHDIAYILEPAVPQAQTGEQVAKQLRGHLDTVQRWQDDTPTLYTFSRHLDKVSRSYWPGLFHCYDVAGLPRTNNELESRFRDTTRHLLRTTGQKGLTGRTLQRQGAWELLPRPQTEAQLRSGLCQIPPEELAQERRRFAEHRRRFRLHSRSIRQTQTQFDQIRQRWAMLPPTGTG